MKGIYTLKKASEVWEVNLNGLRTMVLGSKTSAPVFFESEANNDSGCWLVTEEGMNRVFGNNSSRRDEAPKLGNDIIHLAMNWGKVVRGQIGPFKAEYIGEKAFKYSDIGAYEQAREVLLPIVDTSKKWGRLVLSNNIAMAAFENGLKNTPMAKDFAKDLEI